LGEGAVADVAIFDIQNEHKVDVSKFKSRGKNSPFNGWALKGFSVTTIVGGEVKYQREE
jgi:dihydroorotase